MLKFIQPLLSAKLLSVALVIEVGFIIGIYVGKADTLSVLQWTGAGVALLGASMMAAMVHAWPKPATAKTRIR